jgi:hypothetical protein
MRLRLLLGSLAVVACVPPRSASVPPAKKEPFVCQYSLNPWYLSPATLRLPNGGRPFAKTKASGKAGVELTLPYGPATQGARLTFTSGWVTMRVNYQPDEGVRLALQSPLPLSQVATLPRGGRVRWTGQEGARLVVTAPRPERLEGGVPLTTTVACEDTSIATLSHSFPKDEFDAPDAGAPRYRELPANTRVPVSVFAGGPTLETLAPEVHSRSVRLLAEEGNWARVRVWVDEARVDGWVPRALLTELEPGGVSNVFGGLGLRPSGREGGGRPNHERCAAEVPLSLRLDGQVSPLGTLRKNAAYREVARGQGWVEVALPELQWVTLEPGAAFVLAEKDAAACAVTPVP